MKLGTEETAGIRESFSYFLEDFCAPCEKLTLFEGHANISFITIFRNLSSNAK